jgi:hypothetical protein
MRCANPAFNKYGIGHCRICSTTESEFPELAVTIGRSGICSGWFALDFPNQALMRQHSKAMFLPFLVNSTQ